MSDKPKKEEEEKKEEGEKKEEKSPNKPQKIEVRLYKVEFLVNHKFYSKGEVRQMNKGDKLEVSKEVFEVLLKRGVIKLIA